MRPVHIMSTSVRRDDFVNELVEKYKSQQISYEDFRLIVDNIQDERTLACVQRRLLTPASKFRKDNTLVCISYISPRDDYFKRFYMTCITAFLNRMLDEWEPDIYNEGYPSQEDTNFIWLKNRMIQDYIRDKTLENLEACKPDDSDKKRYYEYQAKYIKTYCYFIRQDLSNAKTAELKQGLSKDLESFQKQYARLETSYNIICSMNKGSKPSKSTKKKKSRRLDYIKPDIYELTEQDDQYINSKVKEQLGIKETKEDLILRDKKIVESFLHFHLRFNTDNHAVCKYKPEYTPEIAKYMAEDTEEGRELLRRYRTTLETKYARCLVPPEDTFVRLTRYIRENYHELQRAAADIYPDHHKNREIDQCLLVYDILTGQDEADLLKKRNAFEERNRYHFIGQPHFLEPGRHYLLQNTGDNVENKVADEFINSILDLNDENDRIARAIIRKRTEKDKKKVGDVDDDSKVRDKMRQRSRMKMKQRGIMGLDDIDQDDYIDVSGIPFDILEPHKGQEEIGLKEIKHSYLNRFTKSYTTQATSFNLTDPNKENDQKPKQDTKK